MEKINLFLSIIVSLITIYNVVKNRKNTKRIDYIEMKINSNTNVEDSFKSKLSNNTIRSGENSTNIVGDGNKVR